MKNNETFQRFDAGRILAVGGILLAIAGIFLGEIYAIFIAHVANGVITGSWIGVIESAVSGDVDQLRDHFVVISDLTEKRGRTMNSHSHLGAFGLLALVLALLQPYLHSTASARRKLAIFFFIGCVLQVIGVYVSYYTHDFVLYVSDFGALLMLVSVGGIFLGLRRSTRAAVPSSEMFAYSLSPPASRYLIKSGLLLILIGMAFGLYYAWELVSFDEPAVYEAIEAATSSTAGSNVEEATAEITRFKRLQSKIGITAAAHSHAIEFGFLMLLLAFVQRYVMLSDAWRLRWAKTVSVGAFALPVCVYLATLYGLKAAAFSDIFGGIALVGLLAMAFGVIRQTGALDSANGGGAK